MEKKPLEYLQNMNENCTISMQQHSSSPLPLVSVCCITYNHEKFIREAIEGFLMQETNFDYEIIIANDCSPDNTDAIVQEYIHHHPKGKLIKYFKHEQNLGATPNFIFALQQCTGKYIALCEGDDYWTDPLKLQKQVDFLEANEEYSACFHRTDEKLNNEIRRPINTYNDDYNKTFTFEELARRNIINTVSVVFRNNILNFPNWFNKSYFGDYVLWMLLSQKGPIYYFPEKMAIYRVGVGILSKSSSLSLIIKWLETLYMLKFYLNTDAFDNQIDDTYKKTSSILINESMLSPIIISERVKFIVILKSIYLKVAKKIKL